MTTAPTRRRRALAALAGGALLAAGLGLPATSGAAAPARPTLAPTASDGLLFVPISGTTAVGWRNGMKTTKTVQATDWAFEADLSAAVGTDAFLYNPGTRTDGFLHASASGAGPLALSYRSAPVSGDFRPLVGDFDGNGVEDVFWYAAGPSPDYLWRFDAAGGHTSTTVHINGSYRPVVVRTDAADPYAGAVGDVADDIIWYAPGSAADAIWDFDSHGGHSTKPISIGGNYVGIVDRFGGALNYDPVEGVLWYDQNGPDYLWRFRASGAHGSQTLPNLSGDRVPIVGSFEGGQSREVLWYRPGSASEVLWSFAGGNGALTQLPAPQVGGTYVTAVGDYDGNGYDDIAWTGGTTATVWTFDSTGHGQQTISGLPNPSTPLTVRTS